MSKIDIVFVDIDCTLLNWSTRPPFFDIDSINSLKEAQKKGVLIFFCTARPYHSVKEIKILDIFTPDGMILANGGFVLYKDKILYETIMEKEVFERLCDLAIKLNVNVEGVRRYDCFFIAEEDEAVKQLFNTYPENIPAIEDYHNQDVIGLTLFAQKDLDEKFMSIMPKDSYYFRYHDYGVDVCTVPHVKGEGIKVVLKELDISKNRAMAIGDDLADISMFEEVKYGVAMANGKEEVIKAAKIKAPSIDESGVKYVIEKYVL